MTQAEANIRLAQSFRKGFSPPFRGGIAENCATAKMGKGHGNSGKPFDINTACYLKPVLRAITQDHVRKVVIKAGVKTMKTFVVEMCAAYYTAHGYGDVALYFGTGDLADDQATTRFLDWMWGIPSMAEKRETIARRFDDTNTGIKFPDKTLRILPANLPSTQGHNLCVVGVCDAFLTGKTGMIDQAIARTTQYEHEKKIILESQGGEEGFDFDWHFDDTNQGELHVICPHCATANIWNWKGWHQERGEDFQAVLPTRLRSHPDAALLQSELTKLLITPARKDAGFKRGDEEKIRLPSGEYNDAAVIRETYYECYHCGESWHDDGEHGATRIALDESSHYVAAKPDALVSNVGFNWPQWINRRLRWGRIMLEYLNAKKVSDMGNKEKLKQWWQKTAARTWSDKITLTNVRILSGSYDPSVSIPDEVCRVGGVDCQQGEVEKMTGKFWYVFRAVDKKGDLYQIARGYAESWAEMIAIQKQHKIPNENMAFDGGQYLHEILDRAAANFELVEKDILNTRTGKPTGKKLTVRSVWKILRGNGTRKSFAHGSGHDRKFRSFSLPSYYQRQISADGQPAMLNIPVYEWSNLSVKDHLHNLLMGSPTTPKFVALTREQLTEAAQAKEIGDLAYSKQMQNEYRTRERNQDRWVAATPNVHYRDCECEAVVLFDMGGYLGLPAAADTAEV